MNKNIQKFLLIVLGSMLVLPGCGGSPGNNTSDESPSSASKWYDQMLSNSVKEDLSVTVEQNITEAVKIGNTVGNIEVSASPDDKLSLKASLQTLNNDSHKSIMEEIVKEASVSVRVDGDLMVVLAHPQEDPEMDLWTWAKRKYGDSKFSINYEVQLPAKVTRFDVSTNVGEIGLSGLDGEYKVFNSVGVIHIDEANIQGKSSLQSELGSLRLQLDGIASGSVLKATTDVGTITAKLPSDSPYSLNIATELGRVSGANKGKSDMNGGGPLITLTSSVGSITVEQ
ncbi:hypothetical protein MUG84_00415 [Paenibacillus sp. KQZ6P-2]|uniref:Adhesin domain-containing protein n=1 Tax=Paenibacillus mangrovi TaxID=2931978 RepID=A0A9X2B371_9BACL|nr:hypothetical protein [Paenibacillus mangrovi]MCJ8010202.1 hypothetical protein [Paenibacillus mangrovi]